MRLQDIGSDASESEWDGDLKGSDAYTWSQDDCRSVFSALSEGKCSSKGAERFQKKLKRTKMEATRRRIAKAAGDFFSR